MSQAWNLILTLVFATIISASPMATTRGDEPHAEPQQAAETEDRKPDVHYVPTPQRVVNLMLELAEVSPNDLLYDLGCGDGRIVVTAAKKYGCKAVGYDIDPERVRESRANVKAAGLEHLVTIEQADIFTLDLSQVDVVMLYLRPHLNVRLIPQLEKMKPGSRVVSHDFDMHGVEPDAEVTFHSQTPGGHKIYLWEVPLNKVDTVEVKAPVVNQESVSGLKTDTARRVAIAVLGSSIALATLLWLLRKRLGMVKFHVTIDRS